MGLLRKALFWVIALPLAVITVFVLWLVWPHPCDAPITCTSDAACGGDISTQHICKDGNVYAQGQQNVCLNAGKCGASCQTSYAPWLVEACKHGCENATCLPG